MENFLSTPELQRVRAESQNCDPEMLAVLVVDDERHVREGLARVLARKGYRTFVAEDADAALAALRGQNFDAVITDIRMPGRSGLDLLREAKTLWPDVHFIIMTAYGEISSYLDARHKGAVEYFNKPVRIDDLVAVLTGIRFRQYHKRLGETDGQPGPAPKGPNLA